MRQPLVIRRGRYELLLPLGEGRLTRSYLAVAEGANQPAVVKRLRPELAHQPQLRASFNAAAHVGKRLYHPQIAATYEVFSDGDEQLFAMEYLEGETLADLVRRVGRSHMPLEEHLYVLSQALAGLAHCHALVEPDGRAGGGNHREACASNIVITYEGDVKLVDFALQEVQLPGPGVRRSGSRTIGPFAPEQLCGLPIDARSDVFAMGVLLWEALARRPRAVGDDRAAMIAARVAGSEPGPEALPADLPRALIDTCARATALDPAARFANPAELAAALDEVRAGFSRAVGPNELANLVTRNFKLDRDALRRRINEHLEDARAAIRLKTPVDVIHEPTPPRRDHEVTVPGLLPSWFDEAPGGHDDGSDDLGPPPRVAFRRLGLATLGAAAVAVLVAAISYLRQGDAPANPVAARPPSGPGWEPIGRRSATPVPVAVDRAGNERATAGRTGHPIHLPAAAPSPAPAAAVPVAPTAPATNAAPAAMAVSATPAAAASAPGAMAAATTPMVISANAAGRATSTGPVRPRPKRPATSSLATSSELTRRTPVPLLDANGGMLTVARPVLQPPPQKPLETPGRGLSPPARRQLDEQDPYR